MGNRPIAVPLYTKGNQKHTHNMGYKTTPRAGFENIDAWRRP